MAHSVNTPSVRMPNGVRLCALQSLVGLPSISESDIESDDDQPNSEELKSSKQKKRRRNEGDRIRASSSKKKKNSDDKTPQKKGCEAPGNGGRHEVEFPIRSLSSSGKENNASFSRKKHVKNADIDTSKKARKQVVRDNFKLQPDYRKKVATVDPFEAHHRRNIQKAGLDYVLRTSSNSDGNIFNFMQQASPFRLEKKVLPKGVAAMAGVSRVQSNIVVKKGTHLILSDTTHKNGDGAGQYSVGKYLGGGSYGSVFSLRPFDTSLKDDFALKVETSVHHLPWEFHVLRYQISI